MEWVSKKSGEAMPAGQMRWFFPSTQNQWDTSEELGAGLGSHEHAAENPAKAEQ